MAYALNGAQQSLWVRQVAAESSVQVVPPGEGSYIGIAFSPDGDYLYYAVDRTERKTSADVYEVPVLGGSPKLILKDVMHGFAISPDGKKIAFIRQRALYAATIDGTDLRLLAEGTGPDTFEITAPPSWSSDGKIVAATSWWRKEGYTTAIRCYPAEGGAAIILPSRSYAFQAVWLHSQRGLLSAVAPAHTKNLHRQIWQQPYSQAEPLRITNDLGDYYDLSLTADDGLLAAVETELTSAVFVAPSSDPDHGVPITTATSDGLAVSWMPNGELLLEDTKYRFSSAQADGSNRVALFDDEGGYGGASVCGDGRFIVFNSTRRSDRLSIWRVDSDGRNLKRLTQGPADFFPHCSPDGAWVIYDSRDSAGIPLMKVPSNGGKPETVVKGPADGGRYSPDGKQIAFYDLEHKNRITVVGSAGGPPLKTFELAPGGNIGYWDFTLLHWTPDGQALTYPLLVGDEMNLWKQSISGGVLSRSPISMTAYSLTIGHPMGGGWP